MSVSSTAHTSHATRNGATASAKRALRNFSKVSLLSNRSDSITVEPTFENFSASHATCNGATASEKEKRALRNFSKVSSLLYVFNQIAAELTCEKFCTHHAQRTLPKGRYRTSQNSARCFTYCIKEPQS